MSRRKAFLIHLLASVAVLAVLAALMMGTWYSMGMLQFSRAHKLWAIVAAVDIIVGPLLTLLVFRSGKPYLKLDLAVIVLLQVAALAYGLKAVWDSRPVFLVALPDQYVLVFANDVPDLPAEHPAYQRYQQLPWFGPERVGVSMPIDPDEQFTVMMQAAEGRDLTTFLEYFEPVDENARRLAAASKSLQQLLEELPERRRESLLAALPSSVASLAETHWTAITSSRGNAIMLIDRLTGAPIEAVEFTLPQELPPAADAAL